MQERRAAPPLSDGERPRRDALRRLLIAGAVAVVVVAVDQADEDRGRCDRLSRGPIHVVWKLDLQLTYNSGAAFSFAQGWAPVLGGLAVVAVLVLLGAVRRVQSTAIAVALGLVVGGALGNLADRVIRSNHGAR